MPVQSRGRLNLWKQNFAGIYLAFLQLVYG